jgi:alkylhydroperoxidase family enzyme
MDRAAALARGEAPPDVPSDLAEYLDKVATAASSLGDADVDGLRTGGHSEDEIIELTEAAALGASVARLDLALAAIGED